VVLDGDGVDAGGVVVEDVVDGLRDTSGERARRRACRGGVGGVG
jgi:hypothetical protein